jgi:hypothetical protein
MTGSEATVLKPELAIMAISTLRSAMLDFERAEAVATVFELLVGRQPTAVELVASLKYDLWNHEPLRNRIAIKGGFLPAKQEGGKL